MSSMNVNDHVLCEFSGGKCSTKFATHINNKYGPLCYYHYSIVNKLNTIKQHQQKPPIHPKKNRLINKKDYNNKLIDFYTALPYYYLHYIKEN